MKCINICFIFPLILLLSVAIAKPFPQQNDLGELDVADATDATDTTSQGEKDISSVNLNSGEAGTNSAAYGLDTDTTIVALNGDKYLQNPESSAAYVGSQIASTPSQDTSSGFGILDKSFLVCPRESSPVCCGDGKPVDAEDRLQCKSYDLSQMDGLCQDIKKIGCCREWLSGKALLKSVYLKYYQQLGWKSGGVGVDCGASPQRIFSRDPEMPNSHE